MKTARIKNAVFAYLIVRYIFPICLSLRKGFEKTVTILEKHAENTLSVRVKPQGRTRTEIEISTRSKS